MKTMIWQKPKSKVANVRAYANLLQQHLGITVTPVYFYFAGWQGPVDNYPCSLMVLNSFHAGGSRFLALNARHPLILAISNSAMKANHPEDKKFAIAMGEAMIWTASWPLPGIDLVLPSGVVYWRIAKGLSCGIQFITVPPARYEEVDVEDSDLLALSIWPRRQYAIVLQTDKAEPSAVTKVITTFGDKWLKRDEVLLHEWKHMTTRGMNPRQASIHIPPNETDRIGMASFSPSLPILALAQFLQKSTNDTSNSKFLRADRAASLGKATAILLSCDRLFCLSLLFNVPLIDRTRTLKGAIFVDHVVRSTPSSEEVTQYREESPPDAHEALEQSMMQRARDIWTKAEGKQVIVCWSGGIDSTALLVCLLRTKPAVQSDNKQEKGQLSILCDDESISEHTSFYEKHIKSKIPTIQRNDGTVSDIASRFPRALIVTGELGDQIFGSDKCKIAFPAPLPPQISPGEKAFLVQSGTLEEEDAMHYRLEDKWEESLLLILNQRGLLAGDIADWQQWIRPQLSKAPFPIVSLFDMLWWLNFSCKWQNVTLRCLHDGGAFYPKTDLTGSIVHFYDDRQLECWACVEEFHRKKFLDLGDWKTYKEPLKKIIFNFDADEEYYRNKEKVGSLHFELPDTKQQRIESCAGLVKNSNGHLRMFSWGLGSVTDCHLNETGLGLEYFLDPWILDQTETTPCLVEKVIDVDPWKIDSGSKSPFSVAPCFVEGDERKHRHLNPITLITLEAKCNSLLPPDLVRGKTVLDLGACLGAMCHWSLYHGAEKAVGVDAQEDFCERMNKYLKSAQGTWPGPRSSRKRFEVVCADVRAYLSTCEDQSFDVIVAAGVLHCFQDPISILLEIARVCKETVVIESVHPNFYRKGFNPEPNSFSGSLLELNPSSAVNKAGHNASFTGLAVVPTKDLMKNLFSAIGFSVSSINVAPHPSRNADVLVYTGSRFYDFSSVRFFLRCERRSIGESKTLITLEDTVLKGEGNEHMWKDGMAYEWTKFRPDDANPSPQAQTFSVVDAITNIFRQEQSASTPDQSEDGNCAIIQPEAFKPWYDIESEAHSVLFEAFNDAYPYNVEAWGHLSEKKSISCRDSDVTSYGYVFTGEACLKRKRGDSLLFQSNLTGGMFFCCPGAMQIEGGSGFLISVRERNANKNCSMFTIAGPLEADTAGDLIGTLPYIDGCSDTILIHPQVKGQPCLNHLHFPRNIYQTQHTHPSGRAGMVIQGEGHCVVVDPITKQSSKTPLRKGMVFVIPTDSPHAFETANQTLDVIAFHPDSDFGPTNTDHPMVNRTIVDGVSASFIPSIQTKFS